RACLAGEFQPRQYLKRSTPSTQTAQGIVAGFNKARSPQENIQQLAQENIQSLANPPPSADGEEDDEGDPLEPGYTLELLKDGQEAPQLAEGEEIVTDPLGLASVRVPAELDDLLPYAFAACREAARRSKNMRHYDVQIIGGIILHQHNIAEMV